MAFFADDTQVVDFAKQPRHEADKIIVTSERATFANMVDFDIFSHVPVTALGAEIFPLLPFVRP